MGAKGYLRRAPARPRGAPRRGRPMLRDVAVVDLEPPAEVGTRDGLAYALFLPDARPLGGVVVLHGAGSAKENHYDFARACRAAGLAAIAFDARGHGRSAGALDGRAVTDVAAIAALLPGEAPVAVRGSSMGGWPALGAAASVLRRAVLGMSPAPRHHPPPLPRDRGLPVRARAA